MSFSFLALYTGDYLRDTVHLSPREHGVYLLMLMWCWQRQESLPHELDRIYRIVGARDPADESAVKYVLENFWPLGEDGRYHNRRLEREIEKTMNMQKRGKAGAAGRWGDAKQDAKSMLDGCQTDAKPMDTTTTTTTTLNTKSKALSGKPDHTNQAREVLGFLNEVTGKAYKPVSANLDLIVARLKEGYTLDDLRMLTARKVEQWKNDDKMAEFLRPKTLYNRTNAANYLGECVEPKLSKVS